MYTSLFTLSNRQMKSSSKIYLRCVCTLQPCFECWIFPSFPVLDQWNRTSIRTRPGAALGKRPPLTVKNCSFGWAGHQTYIKYTDIFRAQLNKSGIRMFKEPVLKKGTFVFMDVPLTDQLKGSFFLRSKNSMLCLPSGDVINKIMFSVFVINNCQQCTSFSQML